MPDFKAKMYQIQFRRMEGSGENKTGRKRRGSQGLVHTPMSKILKNSLIAELI